MNKNQRIENEGQILKLVSEGDSQAFRTLYMHYYDRFVQLCHVVPSFGSRIGRCDRRCFLCYLEREKYADFHSQLSPVHLSGSTQRMPQRTEKRIYLKERRYPRHRIADKHIN